MENGCRDTEAFHEDKVGKSLPTRPDPAPARPVPLPLPPSSPTRPLKPNQRSSKTQAVHPRVSNRVFDSRPLKPATPSALTWLLPRRAARPPAIFQASPSSMTNR